MKKDKRVFVVKNNDVATNIYKNAEMSFLNESQEVYYTQKENRQHLAEEAEIGDSGLLLMLTYDREGAGEVRDIFIGEKAEVLADWKITYIMRRHLQGEQDARAIQSIIDKLDLDEIIKKNEVKAKKKMEKAGVKAEQMAAYANMNTKKVSTAAKASSTPSMTAEEKEEAVRKSTEYYNKNAKPGSMMSKANMVKQYNEKNNK